MTGDAHELSEEQAAALLPAVKLIEAGPGAGKTRTVVARFRERATHGSGIALLSFTNAAVNVAKQRCSDIPGLAEPPNFIGTFDQFFHRYVVTPDIRRRDGKAPSYVRSWADLPDRISTAKSKDGKARIRLTAFSPASGGAWAVDARLLRGQDAQTWNKLYPTTKNQINAAGTATINGLLATGVLDTVRAREHALAALNAPGNHYLHRLAQRFTEVIVDEFQDCDEVEHTLLRVLGNAGIHVVAVADPDQAIYEFRQTSADVYETFRDQLKDHEIATLTTCFRSSKPICALTTGLRKVGLGPITSHPKHQDGAEHVHIVVGTGREAGTLALDIARGFGISARDTRVIAHQRSDARGLLRAGKEPPSSTSAMLSLLEALATLRSSSDIRGRLMACHAVEGFILRQYEWSQEPVIRTRAEQLDHLGVGHVDMRVITYQLLRSSHDWSTAAECKLSVKQQLTNFAANHPIELRDRLANRLVIPDKVWAFWESRTDGLFAAADGQGSRWSHVHSIKGAEFPAVIYAIPTTKKHNQKHVLEDWTADLNSEQRRVLYVGVSRAERLLILVVQPARLRLLLHGLKTADVPHTITRVAEQKAKKATVVTEQPSL